VKRSVVLLAVVALLIALLISGLSDATALVADTGISDNDKASSVGEADNPDSASATITITWTTARSPDE